MQGQASLCCPLVECSGDAIGGLGGSILAADVETAQLLLIDDKHRPHEIILYNVLFVLDSPMNLISPQRWAHESAIKERANKGTFFCNFGDESIFVWSNIRCKKTIFNDPATNLHILQCKDINYETV